MMTMITMMAMMTDDDYNMQDTQRSMLNSLNSAKG
jgi:hypothetical protein